MESSTGAADSGGESPSSASDAAASSGTSDAAASSGTSDAAAPSAPESGQPFESRVPADGEPAGRDPEMHAGPDGHDSPGPDRVNPDLPPDEILQALKDKPELDPWRRETDAYQDPHPDQDFLGLGLAKSGVLRLGSAEWYAEGAWDRAYIELLQSLNSRLQAAMNADDLPPGEIQRMLREAASHERIAAGRIQLAASFEDDDAELTRTALAESLQRVNEVYDPGRVQNMIVNWADMIAQNSRQLGEAGEHADDH